MDDYSDARELYASCFSLAGYDVSEAAEGAAALQVVTTMQPDCVVMDLAMPVMDGWEALRHIRSDPSTASVIVIVLSGHASPADLQRARDGGADEVLTKPCLPAHLIGHVERLLKERLSAD